MRRRAGRPRPAFKPPALARPRYPGVRGGAPAPPRAPHSAGTCAQRRLRCGSARGVEPLGRVARPPPAAGATGTACPSPSQVETDGAAGVLREAAAPALGQRQPLALQPVEHPDERDVGERPRARASPRAARRRRRGCRGTRPAPPRPSRPSGVRPEDRRVGHPRLVERERVEGAGDVGPDRVVVEGVDLLGPAPERSAAAGPAP